MNIQKVQSCSVHRAVVVVIPVMQPCTAATAIIDTQQKNHQCNMEYSHRKADTIHGNIANQTITVLTHLQCNARLVKCWNLHHDIQLYK